jgi:hypothetical protein
LAVGSLEFLFEEQTNEFLSSRDVPGNHFYARADKPPKSNEQHGGDLSRSGG